MKEVTTIQVSTQTLQKLRIAKALNDFATYEEMIVYLLKQQKD